MTNKNAALHNRSDKFEIRDNCICAGGQKVTTIADELGRTPFYVYDRAAIERRVDRLREMAAGNASLHYAIKANPMPDVVHLLATLVDGLDVASAGELHVALKSGCDPRDISFAGPGKTRDELKAAVQADVTINIESETELSRLVEIASAQGARPNVAVRVNPDFELRNSGMKMSGGPKQFGIDAERVPGVLNDMASLPVEFRGFHIFTGSQNLRADAICESLRNALDLALQLAEHGPADPQLINIGGGFGIPYFPGEADLDLKPIALELSELRRKVDARFPDAELVLELGRFIVGEAGMYICEILDRKISRGQVFLITNGGLHHHLAASGNFGQVIRKNYPVAIANRIGTPRTELVSVVGPLCTPLDLLADRMELAEAGIGDLVAVFQSGAYGFTASPHLFLGHPPPVEVLV